jgi:hypothetical protein
MLSLFILHYFINKNTRVFYFRHILICLLLFSIGIAVWIVDQIPFFCIPESIFQLHAFWHLFTAIAIFYLYFYLRSEEKRINIMKNNEEGNHNNEGINNDIIKNNEKINNNYIYQI